MKLNIITKLFIYFFLVNGLSGVQSQIVNEFGIKLGLNSAYHTSYIETDQDRLPNDDGSKSRIGYNIGIFASFINSYYFNLLIEPRLTEKGYSIFFSKDIDNLKLSLTYFSISILGKPKITTKYFTGYLLVGTSMNWLVGRNENTLDGIFKNARTKTNSIVVGAGLQKPLSKKVSISFEFKYDLDIQTTPLSQFTYNGSTYTNIEYGQTIRNRTFEFLLGIGFR